MEIIVYFQKHMLLFDSGFGHHLLFHGQPVTSMKPFKTRPRSGFFVSILRAPLA